MLVLPVQSLDPTERGSVILGATFDLQGVATRFTSAFELYNAIDGGVVVLQGSLDHENFIDLDEYSVSDMLGERKGIFTSTSNPHAVRYVRHVARNVTGTNAGIHSFLAAHPLVVGSAV